MLRDRRPLPRSPSSPEERRCRRLREHALSFHHAWGGGGGGACLLLFFLNFLFCFSVSPSSLPPLPVLLCFLFLQPSATLTSAAPAALPPGSCPALTFVPRPGCGRLSTACRRTRPSGSGDIPVFSLQKAPGRANAWSRGAYLNFWLRRPQQPASALQLLPEAAFWWPPADSALCRLPCPVVRVGAARGHPAPFRLTVREAVTSAAWVARRRGPVEAALRIGFRAPPSGRGLRCPVGSQDLAQSLRRRLWALASPLLLS